MSAEPPFESSFHKESTSALVSHATKNNRGNELEKRTCTDHSEFLPQKFNGKKVHRARRSVAKR